MRTLNKTLCLVLALVMVLGMFGVATATEFTDDETIQYKEAVGVMTGIGAINGMGDGTFAPTGNVTRAQAAKMVAYAVLGADIAETLPVVASSFKDVDANFAWAIPSIEYLVGEGVINGRGDGTFDPNGNVTAYEIAKMLLVAAGYGKNGEFVGPSWALNVAIVAQKSDVKLFAGTKATDLNAAATREECALYCFSGLTKVDQVNYDKTKDAYVAASTIPTTIATDVYGYTGKVGDTTHGYVYQVTKVEQDDVKISATYGKLLATAETLKDSTALGYKFVVDSFDAVGNCFNLYVGTVNTETVVYSAVQLTNEVAAPVGATAQAAFTKTYNLASQKAPLFENYAVGADVTVATYAGWNSSAVVMPDTDKDGYDEIVAVKSDAYTIEVLSATANSKGQYVATLNGVTVADETAATPYNYIATDIDFSKYTDGGLVQVYKYLAYGATDLYKVAETSFTLGVPVKIDTNGTYTMKDGKTLAATSTTHNAGIIDPAILSKGYTVSTPDLQSATATNPTTYVFFLDANGNYFAAAKYEGTVESSAYYATYVYKTTDEYGAPVFKVQAVDVAGELQTFTVAAATADALVAGTSYTVPEIINDSYKVTVNAATGIATFEALDADYNAAVVHANTIAKNEALLDTVDANNCYMNENTKFVFVPADGAPAFASTKAIVVKTGVDEVIGQTISDDSLMYYAKTTSGNKTVSTVIVNHAFNPAVANDATGVIFVPAEATATASVSGANYYTVYLDGVKTTDFLVSFVNTTPTDAAGVKLPAGFYSYSTVKGTAVLADYAGSATADCTDKAGEAITNYYNGLFTTSTFTNTSFEGATIVDLRTEVAAGTETAINTTSGLASLVAVSKNMGMAVTIAASYPISAAGNGTPTVVYILGVA